MARSRPLTLAWWALAGLATFGTCLAQVPTAGEAEVLRALERVETAAPITSLHWSSPTELAAYYGDGSVVVRATTAGLPISIKSLLDQVQAPRSIDIAVSALWPGGRRLGFYNGSEVFVRDLETGAEHHRFSISPGEVASIALDLAGETVAVVLEDGQVCAWEPTGEGEDCRPLEEGGVIKTMALDANGEVVAVGSWNHVVIWDLATDAQTHLRRDLGIQRLVFSPAGRILALGSSSGSVHLWDQENGRNLDDLGMHSGAVTALAFDATGQFLATAANDRTINIWDVYSKALLSSLVGAEVQVKTLAFDHSSSRLAAAEADGSIRIWALSTGELAGAIEPHRREVRALAWSGASGVWSLVPDRSMIHEWNLEELGESRRFYFPESQWGGDGDVLTALAISPDGQYLATGSQLGWLALWSREALVSDGDPFFSRKVHRGSVLALAFNGTGDLVASGASNRQIRLWNLDGRSRPQQLEPVDIPNPAMGRHHDSDVIALSFLADSRLVSGARDRKVKEWDTTTGQAIAEISLEELPLALGGEPGSVLAIGANKIFRWSPEKGQIEQVGALSTKPLIARFSPGEEWLTWTSGDGLLHVARNVGGGSFEEHSRLLSGSRGAWAACQLKGPCRVRDDGSLLYSVEDSGAVVPVVPGERLEAGLEAQVPEEIDIEDGRSASLRVILQNVGNQDISGLRLELEDPGGVLMLHSSDEVIDLRAGERRALVAELSWDSGHPTPQGGVFPLRLQAVGRNLMPWSLPAVSVRAVAPEIRFEDFEFRSSRREVGVRVVNSGTLGLETLEARLNLSAEGFAGSSPAESLGLRVGESQRIRFELPEGLAGPGLQAEIRVRSLALPPHEWSVSRTLESTPSPWLLAGLVAFVFSLAMMGFVHYTGKHRRLEDDPLVQKIEASPKTLRTLDLSLLPKVRSVLMRRKRLESVVGLAGTQVGWLDKAVSFATSNSARRRYEILVDRLRLEAEVATGKPGANLWPLKLSSAFALNLDSCLLYFPSAEVVPADAIQYLKNQLRDEVVVVVSPKPEHQVELEQLTSTDNHWVAPSMGQLTEIFLASDPLEKLAHVISDHVPLTRITPYQLRGGVDKPSLFFGREQLLVNIVDQVSNYLLVGGRQVGKSSLLKAVYRRFKGDDRIDCHYIVLSNHELLRRLARAIGIKKKNPDIVDVSRVLRGKKHGRYLILVDEADLFIKHDREQGFPMLQRLRSWSEEGRVHFVLTGFWQLFDAAVLDYHSPIKNFGATLTIGALEEDACRRLATDPMALLKVSYDSEELVDRLIEETGQRANLVSIVCSELIEGLDPEDRVIKPADLDRALGHSKVTDALAGWGSLSGPDGETANRIDRIVVYSTLEKGEFTLGEVFDFFGATGRPIQPEVLERSLRRLELAFVLNRNGDQLGYQVPLFRRWILRQNPAVLLEQELVWWRRESVAPEAET